MADQKRSSGFIEVRSSGGGRLLFLFDPARDLIVIRHKGSKGERPQFQDEVVDLRRYRAEGGGNDNGHENGHGELRAAAGAVGRVHEQAVGGYVDGKRV